jgi:hypothetical protein
MPLEWKSWEFLHGQEHEQQDLRPEACRLDDNHLAVVWGDHGYLEVWCREEIFESGEYDHDREGAKERVPEAVEGVESWKRTNHEALEELFDLLEWAAALRGLPLDDWRYFVDRTRDALKTARKNFRGLSEVYLSDKLLNEPEGKS